MIVRLLKLLLEVLSSNTIAFFDVFVTDLLNSLSSLLPHHKVLIIFKWFCEVNGT